MLISDDHLKKLVLQKGLATEKTLHDTMELAKSSSLNFSQALIEKDVISDEALGQIIAEFLKLPFISLSKIAIPEEVFNLLPEKVARKQKVIPFALDENGLKIAMADPRHQDVVRMLAKKINTTITPHLATQRDIYNTLHIYRKGLQKAFDNLINEEIGRSTIMVTDEAPIAKIVDLLIDYAYQDKASDIHIEPGEKNSLIRFRIDGILHDVLYMPKPLHDRVVSRLKVLSKLRTDEHLSPQDGQIRITLEENTFDLRVSIVPVVHGEKIVMRLLSTYRDYSLTDLGFSDSDLKKLTIAHKKPYGMILSTGPTGSGKTTTIYSILKILNTRDKNITTIEDPVEYRIKKVNQIQVNAKTNLTFANGLRSILRQDPNIIFVGEIRDNETAAIAVNAALTGHLVLSTLHTNDAATALPRLIDMRVEPFLVASTVNLIIAQRLVRSICEICIASTTIERSELLKHLPEKLISKYFGPEKKVRVYKGKGCKICHNTGYKGRVGIFEVLEISKQIRKAITEKSDSDVINKLAIDEGMNTMLEDGLKKVAKGVTTIEEVLRVTKVESA